MAYIDQGRGISIDIEVDEPYAFSRHISTHAKGRDNERNRLATQAGWVVLRPSEQQAVTIPGRVVRTIMDAARDIAPDVAMPHMLQDMESAPEPSRVLTETRRRAAFHASDAHRRQNILYRLMSLRI